MISLRRVLVILICLCMVALPITATAQEKLVALTFDDGPSGIFTKKLLAGLDKRGGKATFLLCGYRMEQYPELTEQIIAQGHEIGLHGYCHKSMENMCQRDVTQEIEKSIELLPEDYAVSFLRPPGGLYGSCVQAAAEEQDLAILHWSIDPKDWATQDMQAIKKAVVDQAQDGDVILMHDMSYASVNAALAIVDALQAKGFRFVTASQLAKARNVNLVPGKKYARFKKPNSEDLK